MSHSFGSDNYSGIHPLILAAISSANQGHVPAYGSDITTAAAKDCIREIFGSPADIYFVFNGTGANVLALRTLTRPYNSILCTDCAHIWVHECGAPEFHTGCKLIALPAANGKLTPEMILPHLHEYGVEHCSQPKVISLTQPTEWGTLYSVDEIKAIVDLAHSKGMYVHIDGTRFANAVAALGVTPTEMVVDTGVDVITFGGTKNGLMLGESVVFLNPELSPGAKYERKQLMQLSSKMRFISAQFEAYLTENLWLEMASHANRMAACLGEKLSSLPGINLLQPVQTNGVFVEVPEHIIPELKKEGYYNIIHEAQPCQLRWMCSFDTQQQDIDKLVSKLESLLQK